MTVEFETLGGVNMTATIDASTPGYRVPDPQVTAQEWLSSLSTPVSGLSPAQVVDRIVAAERLKGYAEAVQAAAMADFARPGRCGDISGLMEALTEKFERRHTQQGADGDTDVDMMAFERTLSEQVQRMAGAEISAALNITKGAATFRLGEALELAHQLPETLIALRDGRIDRQRARVLATETRVLESETRGLVEAQMLPLASRTPGKFENLVRRAVDNADPQAADRRHRAARKGRRVEYTPLPNGIGLLSAYLTAEGANTCWTLLNLIADATPGSTRDDRGIDAIRADVLTDIMEGLLTDGVVDITALTSRDTPATPGVDGATGADIREEAAEPGEADSAAGPTDEADLSSNVNGANARRPYSWAPSPRAASSPPSGPPRAPQHHSESEHLGRAG